MPRRIYMDTSVFGGCFEPEFRYASTALIDEVRAGRTVCVFSVLTRVELEPAPEWVRALVRELPNESVEKISMTPEAIELAHAYVAAGVVSIKSSVDAEHVALATIARVDAIVSWNFKHLVNLNRIRGFNGVNLFRGYPLIEIRTPGEVLLEP